MLKKGNLLKSSVILFSIFLFSSATFAQMKNIELSDFLINYTFSSRGIGSLRSMNNGKHYTILEKRSTEINKYAYENGEKLETILNLNDLNDENVKSIGGYKFSKSESKLLIYNNTKSIYRHSFYADYYIYDLSTKKLTKLSEDGQEQVASFSPDGSKVAYIIDNNIFYKDLKNNKITQVTEDGKFNKILNGKPDWVYEEEFGFKKAFNWSPNGNYIAYIKFDESKVKSFSIPIYAGERPTYKKNKLYPGKYEYKYPKAGEDNSIVSVHTFNIKNNKTTKIDIGKNTDIYIPRIRWTQTEKDLAVMRLNREQNHLEILFANPKTGATKTIYSEKNKYYIHESNYDNLKFLDDGKHFVFTNETSGFTHLYLYDMSGKLIQQLTKGNWEVTNFYGYDSSKQKFYYQAAAESPLHREVYSVKMNGKGTKKLSDKVGTNSFRFSKGFKYYISIFSNASTPPQYLLKSISGKTIKILEDNADLQKKLKKYNHSKKEFIKVKTEKGMLLNAWIIKPHNFDSSKKYPVLVTQYSGPNSQSVKDNWSFGWEQALANQGFIVTCVDTRGTGVRGEAFCKVTYKQLGKYETIDLIDFAKWLGQQSYIDKNKIGVWGWSYGGYMSLLCMTKGADYFSTGIAVAPVTNWRYYDNIYTERFMRKPQDNDGYDTNSPITYADKLKGKLLICHGSFDDNVHIQNSWEMIEKLVQANKQFDMQFYTNRNHGIYGGNTRLHLYTKFVNFLNENLK